MSSTFVVNIQEFFKKCALRKDTNTMAKLARFFLVDIVPIHLPTTFNASQFLHGLFTSHGHLLDLPDEEVSMWCKEPLKKLQRIECCQEVSSELCTFRNNTDTRSNPFFSGWHSSELTSQQRSMLRIFFTGSLHHMDTSSIFQEVSMWCKEPVKKLQRIECCQEVSFELCSVRKDPNTLSN